MQCQSMGDSELPLNTFKLRITEPLGDFSFHKLLFLFLKITRKFILVRFLEKRGEIYDDYHYYEEMSFLDPARYLRYLPDKKEKKKKKH